MSSEEPVVFLTPTTSVKGKVVNIKDSTKPVYTYLAIPFAEAPEGTLRFEKPVPKKLWEGQRDATQDGVSPVQNDSAMAALDFPTVTDVGEDCLHLNINTPSKTGDEKLPVMVWLYGGGLQQGTINFYPGRVWAAHHDVVYVAINYRVNILGFFSTGDETCKGNFGIWDQIEGLKWVQKYISKFGGDPNNVTLFGESAGAICTGMLSTIPQCQDLFHKTILLSGVPTVMPAKTPEEVKQYCAGLAKAFEFPDDTSPTDLYKKLMDLSVEEIVPRLPQTLSVSAIDGELFSKGTEEVIQNQEFSSKIPSIISINTHEGGMFYKLMLQPYGLPLKTKDDMHTCVKIILTMAQKFSEENIESMAKEIVAWCVPQDSPSETELLAKLIDILGVHIFGYEIDRYVKKYSDTVPGSTYHCVYGYRPSNSKNPEFVGADHGDDIVPVMGIPFLPTDLMPYPLNDNDRKMSKITMQYYANFAKTGNPNGGGLPEWTPYNTADPNYLYMDLDKIKVVKEDYQCERNQFWGTLLAKYSKVKNSQL